MVVAHNAQVEPEQLSMEWPEDLPLGLHYDEGYADEAYSCYVETTTSTGIARFTPEVRLRVAVLGDAIWCLQLPTKRRDGERDWVAVKLRREARNWLHGSTVSAPTCSFDEVCETVGLDPEATRDAIFARMASKVHFDVRLLCFWLK